MTEAITPRLTFHEARKLTDDIKGGVESIWDMLLQAYRGFAWAALGYPNWREYAMQEFKFSKSRAYQMLDYAKVTEALGDDFSTNVEKPTEFQARPLTKLESPEQQREAWEQAVEASDGKPTAKHVEAAVEEIKERHSRPLPEYTPTPQVAAAIEQAEKDSETLWSLKSYWKKAGKKDRAKFLAWINGN